MFRLRVLKACLLITALAVPAASLAAGRLAVAQTAPPAVGMPAAAPAAAQGIVTPEEPVPNPLGVKARSGLLMDAATGQVLYAFNEHEKVQPASLAKIMTFDLALEAMEQGRLRPETRVTISENAWRLALNNRLSNMFIEVGRQVYAKDLLLGLMVSSGNDAAVALAEHLAGTEAAFVRAMNEQARRLGLTETRFTNSHGLAAPDQYTTAADVANLTRHVITAHPDALRIASVKEFTFNNIRQFNWNKLVLQDPRVNGLKTGHLPESGYHLSATASDQGMSLIAVVIGVRGDARRDGETARAAEASALLNYGFNNFVTREVVWREKVAPVTVYKGKARQVALAPSGPVRVTVPRGQENAIDVTVEAPRRVVAPVRKGQALGRLSVRLNDRTLAGFDLLATGDVPRAGFFRSAWDSLRLFFANLFGR